MEKKARFADFKLNKQILAAIDEAGYLSPTPIQSQAIPLALSGHDVMGVAQTGTGKTAAFVCPLLMKLKYAQGQHPRALILSPTRELAIQIHENVLKYSTYLDLRHAVAYGGTGIQAQAAQCADGIDLLVATPGRFMDLYRRQAFHPKSIHTLVIDEADKMMDMGFIPQIRRILEVIPVKRQNLLFSATLPPVVEQLAAEFLEFPEKVEVTPQASAAETVEQHLYAVPNFKTKIHLLGYLLMQEELSRVIVFVKTKQHADNVYKYIKRKITLSVKVIHGNKAQNTRLHAIQGFKAGEIKILVATDVAARGLDVSQVSHVINFDMPLVYEDYVHRIGRTGRAQRSGVAISFANEEEAYHVKQIERMMAQSIPQQPFPNGLTIEKTPFEEKQAMLKAIDYRKQKADPSYSGAFHPKKQKKRRR